MSALKYLNVKTGFIALIAVAAFLFISSTGADTLGDSQFNAVNPSGESTGSLDNLLSISSCSSSYFKCIEKSLTFGSATAYTQLNVNEFDIIDEQDNTFTIEPGTELEYKCVGSKAYVKEGGRNRPDLDYSESGVSGNYEQISKQGSIDLSEYDTSKGITVICTDTETASDGSWSSLAIWNQWEQRIRDAVDSDGDGLYDVNDDCPDQGDRGFGVKDNGCPIVDSDSDGVPDPQDECPFSSSQGFGVKDNGCPIEDDDNDGVPNPEDEAPDTPGSQSDGTPTVIERAVQVFISGWTQGESLF